jgi:hypothetical protein
MSGCIERYSSPRYGAPFGTAKSALDHFRDGDLKGRLPPRIAH